MTTEHTEPSAAVGVNVDAILSGYADALAGETQRRIIAEATVAALQEQLSVTRGDLAGWVERATSAETALADRAANAKRKGTDA